MPSLTIDVTPEQAARIQHAVGRHVGAVDEQGENRDATSTEVRQTIIQFLKDLVRKQEQADAVAAAKLSVVELDVADAV